GAAGADHEHIMFKRFVTTHKMFTTKGQSTGPDGSRITSFTVFRITVVETLEDPPVMPDTQRAESHVQVRESDPEQAHPGPEHMAPVQTTHAGVSFGADWLLRDLIQKSADQMAKGVTPERVSTEQNYVESEND